MNLHKSIKKLYVKKGLAEFLEIRIKSAKIGFLQFNFYL